MMFMKPHEPHSQRTWKKQVAWNDKMRRLLKADGVIPVHPAPDYSLKALEAWAVSQSVTALRDGQHDSKVISNMWWRQMHALLAKEPPSTAVLRRAPQGEVT